MTKPALFLSVLSAALLLGACAQPSTSRTFVADCTDNLMHDTNLSAAAARSRCVCVKQNITRRYGSVEAASEAKRRNPAAFRRNLGAIESRCK